MSTKVLLIFLFFNRKFPIFPIFSILSFQCFLATLQHVAFIARRTGGFFCRVFQESEAGVERGKRPMGEGAEKRLSIVCSILAPD